MFIRLNRTTILYGVAMATAAFGLSWFEYQYAVRRFSSEIYIVAIAVAFAVLGIWVGNRLASRAEPADFAKNTQALEYLGISDREYEVLTLLAEGRTNQEIARALYISPNTVKTHLARLYEKLEVSRRTQAVAEAKSLSLIP